jgi:hypothetical protein
MRPNSLWDGASSAPWVVGHALTDDIVFAGQHGLLATDFDSNVAQVCLAPLTLVIFVFFSMILGWLSIAVSSLGTDALYADTLAMGSCARKLL